jgi:hypothetical protein
MKLDIVGEAEIAARLGVKPNTVHQWAIRGLLPESEGTVSGRAAWRWSTIQAWADRTGRTSQLGERILEVLRSGGPGTTSEVTARLAARGWVHRSATVQVWRVLNDLYRDGKIGVGLTNRWFLAGQSPL